MRVFGLLGLFVIRVIRVIPVIRITRVIRVIRVIRVRVFGHASSNHLWISLSIYVPTIRKLT